MMWARAPRSCCGATNAAARRPSLFGVGRVQTYCLPAVRSFVVKEVLSNLMTPDLDVILSPASAG
jgi:hypothetical protein